MKAEILQFASAIGVFGVVALLWLRIVYLPGRTLERWKDQRVHEKPRREDSES